MAISGSLNTLQAQAVSTPALELALAYAKELLTPGTVAAARVAALKIGDNNRIELGGGVFAMEQAYLTKDKDQGRWESHLAYIDLQLILEGDEQLWVCDKTHLTVDEDLTPAKDLIFFKATTEGGYLRLKAGEAALLYPIDAHLPGIRVEAPVFTRKSVVKIPVAG